MKEQEVVEPGSTCPCKQKLPWHLFELGMGLEHICSCERTYRQELGDPTVRFVGMLGLHGVIRIMSVSPAAKRDLGEELTTEKVLMIDGLPPKLTANLLASVRQAWSQAGCLPPTIATLEKAAEIARRVIAEALEDFERKAVISDLELRSVRRFLQQLVGLAIDTQNVVDTLWRVEAALTETGEEKP